MSEQFKVPLIIRGEIIEDYTVEFGGRQGGAFVTPDINRYFNQLVDSPLAAMAAYQDMPIEEIARFLDELARLLDFDRNADMRLAYQLSAQTSGISAPVLEFMYRNLAARMFQRDYVLEYTDKLIGIDYLEGWVRTRMRDGTESAVRAYGARCVNVIAGNTPGVAFSTVLRSAVTRSDCITKMPSNDPLTMAAVLKSMIELDRDHPVTRHMSAVYWKGGNQAFESKLYHPSNVEKIIAWGGFDSIRHITQYLQPGLDLITLDPKHSASIVGREALADDETMRKVAQRAAADIGAFNQEACANARTIYVECDYDDPEQLERLNRLGEYMYAAMQTLPATLSTRAKYIVPALKEELDGLFMLDDYFKLYRDDDHSGAIIVSQADEPVGFAGQLACRTANIVPLPSIDRIVACINSATQTVGVYPSSLKERIRSALAVRGAQMIISLGYVSRINTCGPLDGIEAERRMLKWVVDQTQDESLPPPWASSGREKSLG
jgi:hypothetical protein